jgi:hypothetical protein
LLGDWLLSNNRCCLSGKTIAFFADGLDQPLFGPAVADGLARRIDAAGQS